MALNKKELKLLVAFFELLQQIDSQEQSDSSEEYNLSIKGRNQ